MRVMTSYFYQIRFFSPNMVPFSTALYDPKWYHDNKGTEHLFFDKRGVVNGLRVPMLVPPQWCANACKGFEKCPVKDPEECAFLKAYGDYVNTLKVDDVLAWLSRACDKIQARSHFPMEPVAVLIFHEKYDNPCSERVPVTKWLLSHDIDVIEFIN